MRRARGRHHGMVNNNQCRTRTEIRKMMAHNGYMHASKNFRVTFVFATNCFVYKR